MKEMLDIAEARKLVPLDPGQLCLECGERCVAWGGKTYTFVSMAFRKAG